MVTRRSEGPEEPPSKEGRGLEAHRRAKRQAEEIPFSRALEWERGRSWPGWRLRRAFWRSERVPEELRREPDPRPTLTMDAAGREQWNTARQEWEERRLAWLQDAADAAGER